MTAPTDGDGAPARAADVPADDPPTDVGTTDADTRTLRRALRAGLRTTGVLAVLTVVANVGFGGDGVTAGIWLATSVVVGSLVSSGWMVLALALDLVAGQVPSRRRALWTAGLFAVAFVSPILPAAMLQVAAAR